MGKSLSLPILIHLLLLAGQGGRMVSAPTVLYIIVNQTISTGTNSNPRRSAFSFKKR